MASGRLPLRSEPKTVQLRNIPWIVIGIPMNQSRCVPFFRGAGLLWETCPGATLTATTL